MITYRQARKLLSPGDLVYSLTDVGGVNPVSVEKILETCLKTEEGYLDFDLHGEVWWLTKKGAEAYV